VKNQFFDFLELYNELGKVKKFRTFRPLFHGEIAIWKKCPTRTIRVNLNENILEASIAVENSSGIFSQKVKINLKRKVFTTNKVF